MPEIPDRDVPAAPELGISVDKVAFIIEKAREYDAKEGDSDPDEGSNPAEDEDLDILEDQPGDSTADELADAIRSLNEEEQVNLVALAWLGRGTYDIDEWSDALRAAREERNGRTAEYLMGLPLLGDYLEDGLAAFDEGIVDEDDENEGVDEEDEPLDGMDDEEE